MVLVTTAEAERVDQASEFIDALAAMGLTLGAVAVNRMMAPLPDDSAIVSARSPAALKRKLKRNLDDFAALSGAKPRRSIACARRTGGRLLVVAPDLGREPRTLADLAEIARSLRSNYRVGSLFFSG